MLAPERHNAILAQLRANGRVYSAELGRQLGVSEDTIRRDLASLAGDGLLIRTHGGAVPRSTTKLEFHARSQECKAEKALLAQRAAEFVHPGQVVLFDAGSTLLAVAQALPRDLKFTAVTHSVVAAAALADLPEADVILLGGRIAKRRLETNGPDTVDACRRIHADLCFMGVAALDSEGGITDPDYDGALMKRTLLESAAKTVVVATAAKLGSACPFAVAPVSAIDVLVTEASAPAAVLEGLRAAGVELVLVGGA